MDNLLKSEHFWIYSAFLIFIIVFGKLIYQHIKNFLNLQILSIKENINNSKKPLEESIQLLKNKKAELVLLNNKIQTFKQKDKENSNILIESFYENLNIKLQYIEEAFNNYLKNEDCKHFNKLANILIKDCYDITIKILQANLTEPQKQRILSLSILKLEQSLTNKVNL